MKIIFAVVITMLTFSSNFAFGMGGDKPGPNGGFVKMPGTYHVELVPKKNSVLVYLLDLSLRNPVTKDSSVTLKLNGKEAKTIECKEAGKSFTCDISAKDLSLYSEINLESVRNKIKGKIATYHVPLKFD